MASQNLDVGSGANANDGQSLRSAFVNVRKMFHDIYGVSDAYTDDLDISGEDFKVNANQINTTNSAASGVDGYVLTYDHATGGFTFEEYFNGDITRVQGGSGLSGDTASGEATINIDLNDLTEAALDVANDDIAFVDTSDSNTTRKESIADIMTAVAGDGLTATSGVLAVSVDTDQIAADAVDGTKLEQFDDSLTAATAGHILVSNGTDFIHKEMTGVIDISSTGATSFDSNVDGDGLTNTSGVLSVDVDDDTIEIDATNGLQVKADGIDHDELADRYSARASAVTTSGATTLDWSGAAIFPVTMGGNHTLNFSNYKKGQVVDIIVSGAYTITLGTSSGTPTINQVGDGTYDNSTTNLIQVVCTDDDSTPEFFYSVGTYTADTNPA